jgi:hypothetical protein
MKFILSSSKGGESPSHMTPVGLIGPCPPD